MAFMIKEDNVVGHWARWHIGMAAFVTIAFYVCRGLWMLLYLALMGYPMPFALLDPQFLILTIPFGIIFGDERYQADLRINGPKTLSLEKEKK